MNGKPWWWPKSYNEAESLLTRIDRFKTDLRLYLLMEAVFTLCTLFFAFVMSWTLTVTLFLIGKDVITNPSIVTTFLIVVFGIICARVALVIDQDFFREMSEVFLGIPLSSRTKEKLSQEFGTEF